MVSILLRFSSAVIMRFVARCSSATSLYLSLLALRGRKYHFLLAGLHAALSWMIYLYVVIEAFGITKQQL